MNPDDVLHVPRRRSCDLNIEKVRFRVWTSATSGDDVLAYDYAPNAGWITADTRLLWDAQIAEVNGVGLTDDTE